jgi:hypothetical protein
MLLIIIVGLMAKLMQVYGDCDIGTRSVNNFDWNKVGICVLIGLLIQAASKIATLVHISLVFQLKNCPDCISHCTFGDLNGLWTVIGK